MLYMFPFHMSTDHWLDLTVRIYGNMIQQKTTISEKFSVSILLGNDNHTAFLHFCVYNGSTIPQQTFGDATSFAYAANKHWPVGEYCIYSMGYVYEKDNKFHWDHGKCPDGLTPGNEIIHFSFFFLC